MCYKSLQGLLSNMPGVSYAGGNGGNVFKNQKLMLAHWVNLQVINRGSNLAKRSLTDCWGHNETNFGVVMQRQKGALKTQIIYRVHRRSGMHPNT